jgi:serine/threonine protein kinase
MTKYPTAEAADGKSADTGHPGASAWPTVDAPLLPRSAAGGPAGRFFSSYEVLEEVARGAMGVVYKARQIGLDRIVAVKMIQAEPSPSALERFALEARAAAALDHTNIVPVYDSGWQDGRPFFTMALVDGESLHQRVRRGGIPDPAEAVRLLLGVVDAVGYAHAKGIVHRDLKPDNVLVDRSGRPRVTDFGLARRLHEDSNLTAHGQVLGTPHYMAPEQARGDPTAVSPAVDIYALGGILYFLLTGNPPFDGTATLTILRQVLDQPPVPPSELNAGIPAGLQAICLKCLEKEPQRRYPSAQALGEALALWASGPVTTAAPPRGAGQDTPPPPWSDTPPSNTSVVPPPAPAGRTRWLVPGLIGGATALAVLAALLGFWVVRNGRQDDPDALLGPGPDLPQLKRQDFALTVDLLGSREGPQGRRLYRAGDPVLFQITTERTAHVGIWSIEADGTITRLFPNKKEMDAEVIAGRPRLIPGNDQYTIRTTATAPGRADAVWMAASTRPWKLSAEGEQRGDFLVFRRPKAREQMQKTFRGMVQTRGMQLDLQPPPAGNNNPAGEKVSVRSFLYIVQPK